MKRTPEVDAALALLVATERAYPVGTKWRNRGRLRIAVYSLREHDLEVLITYTSLDDIFLAPITMPAREFLDGRFQRDD